MFQKIILLNVFVQLYTITLGQENRTSRFYTDSIYSVHLSEYRKMNIYLPAGFEQGKTYPMIYATDGLPIPESGNNPYTRGLDSLISNRLIPPMILVESYSNDRIAESYTTSDGQAHYFTRRNYEYVEEKSKTTADSALNGLFDRHLRYFSEELVNVVESKLNLDEKPGNRMFYGFSNGAGFGINMMNKKPGVFGMYICLSSLGSNIEELKWRWWKSYPLIFIMYGDEEHVFFKEEAETCIKGFRKTGTSYVFKTYHGGHDHLKWEKEFQTTLVGIFRSADSLKL